MTSITGENGYSSDYQPAGNKNATVNIKRHHYGMGNKAKKLQGNKRKTKYYFNGWFSRHSLVFLGAALLQAVLITGLIIPSLVVGHAQGEFSNTLIVDENGTLYGDLTCGERGDLRDRLDDGFRPLENDTRGEPTGLGEDKVIYVILFLCVVLYNFALLCYALKVQSILEVCAFVLLNMLVTMYAVVQVYQFRKISNTSGNTTSDDDDDDGLTDVGYFALAMAIVLLVMTVVFVILFKKTYYEFGWKMYKKIRRSEWRFYYRWYETLMSLAKLDALFLVIFLLGQCILLLDYCNYEFYLSIILIVAIIILLPLSYYFIRNEFKYITWGLGLLLILQAAYLIFKIVRFATKSCPLCKLRTSLEFSDREQTFEHLIMLAAINLAICILTFLTLLVVYKNYGKGLREQFRINTMNSSGNELGSTTSMNKVMKRNTDLNMDQTDSSMSGKLGRPPSEQFQLEPDLEAGMGGTLPRKYFKRHDTNQAIPTEDIKSPSFSPELNCIAENELPTPQIVDNPSALDTPPRPQKLNFATQ